MVHIHYKLPGGLFVLLFRLFVLLSHVSQQERTLSGAFMVVPSINIPSPRFESSETKNSLVCLKGSKWDDLVDEDEEGYLPIPPVMKYEPRNIKRQNENFVAIREAGGSELTNDVYVKDPLDEETFWFVGKVARISDVSLYETVAQQWPLIEQHAANLRPIELFPKRGTLEIWTAPGDSELDVAYNRPNITFVKMEREVEGASKIKNNMIGFQGEVYQQGEDGFRTWRTQEGKPARPEIQGPQDAEKRAPTEEELEEIRQYLEGQDLNELFENQ